MGFRSFGVPTRAAILLVAVEAAVVVVLSIGGAARGGRKQEQHRDINRTLVRELRLTDLALAPGTSYTRHPSQSDSFAPHSEHPAAIEHFPAGSVMQPPASSMSAFQGPAERAAP
ncbi:MAG TPA: hypothetical protein VLT81_18005 [Chondromyces sp.]|nr:hypothetical protein [Chondromyces sp.]